MVRDKAEKQKRRAQEMLGISDDRAKEIFEEQPDRKQQKKKELEKEGKLETENEEPEPQETESTQADYQEVVSETIADAKEQLLGMDNPDYEAALQAEKENKDRTTFIDWLESKVE